MRKVELLLPDGREGALQIGLRIEAGLLRRDDDAVGEPGVEGPVARLDVEIETALVAPPLELDDAIALPRRMALGQRKPAGLGEQIHQHDRLEVDGRAVARGDVAEQPVADIGPWRLQREIVIDLARHAGSRAGRRSATSDQRALTGARSQPHTTLLMRRGDTRDRSDEKAEKTCKFRHLTVQHAILTWGDAVSMVRPAL